MANNIPAGQEYYFRPYRWVILVAIALIQFTTNFANIQISALAGNIIEAMNLTTAQFGAVASCSFLGGAIFGFICGNLGDRYGIKKVIALTGVLSIIGAIIRVFSQNFVTLFIGMFLIGVVMAALNANSAKIIARWFHPKQMGLIMSIYVALSTVGAVVALSSTPILMAGGMDIRGIFIIGLVTVIIAVIVWVILAREKPEGYPEETEVKSAAGYIKDVIGHKHLWLNSIAMFLMMGAFISCSTYMVVGTVTYKGLTEIQAGAFSSISAIVAVPLMIIVPAIITKTGKIKGGTCLILAVGAILVSLAWSRPNFTVPVMAVMIIGISLIGNGIPLMKQFPAYLPGIPQDSIGTAGGLQSTFQNLGAFLVPSYILGAIVGANIYIIFFGITIVVLIAALIMLFVPNINIKNPDAPDAKAAEE